MSRISELPDFPWDTLAAAKAKANAHPDGIVDLSVGTPIDATPQIAKKILAESAEWPGYPTVWGTAQLRGAIISYLSLRWRAPLLPETSVMPAIGTKELVAWLPTLLGLGKDDLVVVPEVAYPTYRVGAILAGAQIQDCDDPAKIQGQPKLIWINSPANPTGQIWTKQQMKDWVEYARSVGAILASDECYGEFGWDSEPTSVLAEDICAGDPSGLLAMHSLSKRSNIAGYRAGFVAGDPEIVQRLVAVRKHAGMMVPGPVQAVMTELLADQKHVEEQRQKYLARRKILAAALLAAGFRIDHSEGSLYLWATRNQPCRETIDWLAERGILAAPGDFYASGDQQHVRLALTAPDERIAAAANRLNN